MNPAQPLRRAALLAWLCTAASSALAQLPAGAAGPAPLELNSADRAELESLPGIGPQLAERLLAARARARFADWADLLRRVRGLGPALAGRLSQSGLRVNGQAYEAAAATPLP